MSGDAVLQVPCHGISLCLQSHLCISCCLIYLLKKHWAPFSRSLVTMFLVILSPCHCCSSVSLFWLLLVALSHCCLVLVPVAVPAVALCIMPLCCQLPYCHAACHCISQSLNMQHGPIAMCHHVAQLLISRPAVFHISLPLVALSCYPVAQIIALCYTGSCLLLLIQLHISHHLCVRDF